MKTGDAVLTIRMDEEHVKTLRELNESIGKLMGANTRLVDAEERISKVEQLLIDATPNTDRDWIVDQTARSIFGPNYGNFVSKKRGWRIGKME